MFEVLFYVSIVFFRLQARKIFIYNFLLLYLAYHSIFQNKLRFEYNLWHKIQNKIIEICITLYLKNGEF